VLAEVFADEVARTSFALVGGTALAEYYFGHRLSNDLDIFGHRAEDVAGIARSIERRVLEHIDGATVEPTGSNGSHRRIVITAMGEPPLQVDLSLLDPPLLGPLHRVGAVNVLSLDDLAVGELMATSDRVEIRDPLDLYALDLHGIDLELTRQLMLRKNPGLAGQPNGLAQMLDRIAVATEKVEWPRTFIDVSPAQLREFVSGLAARVRTAIAADARERSAEAESRFRETDHERDAVAQP